MKVNTKYNLGDRLWFLENNMVRCGVVTNLYIILRTPDAPEGEIEIRYIIGHDDDRRLESTLYSTKEDLLRSI